MGMQQKTIIQVIYLPIRHTWLRLRVRRGTKLLHLMIDTNIINLILTPGYEIGTAQLQLDLGEIKSDQMDKAAAGCEDYRYC